jgi:hypothetical protein
MQYFQFCSILIGFVFSIRIINNTEVVGYMKGFYWYSFFAVCFCSISILNLQTNMKYFYISQIVNKFSYIFHYLFLGIFIYRVLQHSKVKSIYLFVFFPFLLVIIYTLIQTVLKKGSYSVGSVTNFCLVFLALFYYYDLFESKPVKDLYNEPAFWIVNGLFICLTITVPLNAIRGLLFTDENGQLNLIMGAIASFAYAGMHLFFLKAYLCSTKPRRA